MILWKKLFGTEKFFGLTKLKKKLRREGGKGLYVGMVNIAEKCIGKKNILFFKLDCTETFSHCSNVKKLARRVRM